MRVLLSIIIIIITFALVGCGENSKSSIDKEDYNSTDADSSTNTSESNEEISFDEEVLETVQRLNNENDDPTNVIAKIRTEYSQLEDEEIKEQILKIYNDSILTLLSIKEPYELLNYFFKADAIEMHYEDMLFDDVKQKIINSVAPIEKILIDRGLTYEYIEEYNEHIKVGKSFQDVRDWLHENNIGNKHIHSLSSGLLTLENEDIVIQSRGGKVWRIFKIKDKNGNYLDPRNTLIVAAREISEMYEGKYEREIEMAKENEKIKIGMTKDEVLSRWGKPEKLNKTTTAHVISEQWVYPNFKYIYFDDGIVTAIQE